MIHTYSLNGFNIAVDAASGAVHAVDELAYDVINRIDEKGPDDVYSDPDMRSELASAVAKEYGITSDEVMETIEDIEDLRKEGLLWSEDPFEEAASEIKLKQSVLKAICLHVAHGCNMDCEYCFAGKGDYSGKSGIMDLETGKRALDFLVENSGSRRNLEVDFFGGEPLINWDVCKELVAYGRELEKKHNKKFNFTLTTNGVLIDEDVIELSNREMNNVVLSLDGRKETHDRMRHSKSGEGTYDRIINNFKALVDSRTDTEKAEERRSSEYYMRGTYTAYNKDFASDVLAMAEEAKQALSQAGARLLQLKKRMDAVSREQSDVLDRLLVNMADTELNARMKALTDEKEFLKAQIADAQQAEVDLEEQAARRRQMWDSIMECAAGYTEFDNELVRQVIQKITVEDAETIHIHFRDSDVVLEQEVE